MTKTNRVCRAGVTASLGLLLLISGCQSTQPVAPAEARIPTEAERAAEEAQSVAVASLGKQGEVLVHGDLALSGAEQVLAADRMSPGVTGNPGSADSKAALVTRAAILERTAGKWSQILLCDEHVKNQRGYLGSGPLASASGWRLEYRQDSQAGLVMRFTPAAIPGGSQRSGEETETKSPALEIRWNKNAKRYQSFDQSHERFLSEIPSLGPAESILK